MARPQLRRLALSSLLSASSSSTGFDYVYLVPIVGGAALLAALALWLAARHGVCRRARSAAPATPPQRKEGDDNEGSRVSEAARFFDSGADYVSLATDSQRTASSLFTGSGRGFKRARASTGGSTGHDLALPEADAARLYALLQQSAARRVSFDKIAFGAPARRGANPARRVWLCQYEGEEMDVTQLVIVAPAAAAGGAAPRQDVTSPRSLQTSRGLSSSSSSVSAAALSPTTANNLPPSSELLPQLEQFVREIRLVASLRHPNIVPFVGVAWSALSTLSLVTDHVPHGDLRVVLKRSRRDPTFSWQTHKLRIALGVARSLVYLHHQSVHSDDPKTPHRPVLYQHLRASSVGLTADFEPLLLDFSAAAASDSKKPSTQETPEKLAAGRGDAFWLAPEVLSGANRATPAADVYAFGVLMSELDSGGKSPFHRELRSHDSATTLRPFQVLHRVASGELRPSLRPDCPPELRAIAHACLAQDPKDRPSAARVCELLLAAVSPVEGGGASFGGIV